MSVYKSRVKYKIFKIKKCDFVFIHHILLLFVEFDLFNQKRSNNLNLPRVLKIVCPAFKQNGLIPKEYTCDGKNINPELTIENIPKQTKSLVLILDDPDSPIGIWNHWLIWNIDPKFNHLGENSVPENSIQGQNDFIKSNYGGPCPSIGLHRYFFRAYALDTFLNLAPGSQRNKLNIAMEKHVIDKGELMGKYKR